MRRDPDDRRAANLFYLPAGRRPATIDARMAAARAMVVVPSTSFVRRHAGLPFGASAGETTGDSNSERNRVVWVDVLRGIRETTREARG
jgi:hypothetical protein